MMDDDTLELVLKSQIHDVEALIAKCKGKTVEGMAQPDHQLAYELQKTELEQHLTYLRDFRKARSIDHAVQDDGVAISVLMVEERRCALD